MRRRDGGGRDEAGASARGGAGARLRSSSNLLFRSFCTTDRPRFHWRAS